MDREQAKKIILHVVKETEPRWKLYDVEWNEIDDIFIQRGYEQGGFHCPRFCLSFLEQKGIFSTDKLGSILTNYGVSQYNRKHRTEYAGSLNAPFYLELQDGKYGKEGQAFYVCVNDYLKTNSDKCGRFFWIKLWQMLICCNYLRERYQASFSYYLKKKYTEFTHLNSISDSEFLSIDSEDWACFKRLKRPWDELYGIGENVFDFIMGDVMGATFVKNSYKFDSANIYFLKLTGISKLLNNLSREHAVIFLKGLRLPYTLREINKGLYTYCSKTEAETFGFCRNRIKCENCAVNDLCEKNFGYNEHDENRENITKKEFESYTETFNTNFEGNYIDAVKSCLEGNLKHIFLKIATEMDFNSYGLKNVESNKILKHRRWGSWGRCGIECSFTPKNNYRQWFFYGIYFNSNDDHRIPFKKDRVPELAFFFDIGYNLIEKSELEKIRDSLKNKTNLLAALKRLSQKGFEDNLTSNLTTSKWRLLCKRIPLTEIDDFSYERIREMFEEILVQLTNETDFKEELM
jgi:hypothetical protein